MRRLAAYVPDRLAAAQILSWCVVPRIAHILRALPPPATDSFARAFDSACVRCFTAIAAPTYRDSGLPELADRIMRLKLRDGGFDIGGQHRVCAAAYVASWAAARPLILRLAPSLAAHLPADFHVRPAALGLTADPAAIPLSPAELAIPAPIRRLHDAIAELPDDVRAALAAFLDAAASSDASPAAAVAAAASASPTADDADAPPPSTALQALLSRPSHDAHRDQLVNSLASAVSDAKDALAAATALRLPTGEPDLDARQAARDALLAAQQPLAKLRSLQGGLGTCWFQRLNLRNEQFITNERFVTAVALHLGLPLAAFEGCSCPCGKALTGPLGPLHVQACGQFGKLKRSETFQDAFDSIIMDVCPDARIEGARPRFGRQRKCHPYATVPDGLDAQGQPRMSDIIPDRVVRGMTDDQVGPSGRYIIDTCIVAPEAGTYAAQAALTAGAAAAQAYARKYATYTPHKLVGDVILPVVCETWGAVHPAVLKRLRVWAQQLRQLHQGPRLAARDTIMRDVMAIWRMRLATALLHARVGYIEEALDKIGGVPARSATAANSMNAANLVYRVQVLGRPGGAEHLAVT
jgi:hypothetical protein